MNKGFLNRHIVIIGCSRGLGRSIALDCSSAGAELTLLDVNPDVESLASEIRGNGGKAAFHITDVCDVNNLKKIFDEIAKGNELNGLIYTPRAREPKNYSDFSSDHWDADLNIALKGAFFCAQAAMPHFKNINGEDPFVIYISSILSHLIGMESVGYHVAKAGLDNLTRYLAVKLGPQGVRINAVQLGWFIKDINYFYRDENSQYRLIAERSNPLRRVGTSEDLMNAILFLGSSRSKFITGQILCLDGGLTIQDQAHIFQELHDGISKK